MSLPISLAIIALAALIHASFQLSVSVLTLLSAHTIGNRKSHAKLLGVTGSFVFGAGFMTLLLLALVTLIFMILYDNSAPQIIWSGVCGLLIGVGVSVWLFYYRREKGTMLWVPRGIAKYLSERTKAVKLNAEAFGLGLSSITAELLFIIAPIAITGLVIISLPAFWQIIGLLIYVVISTLSLVIIWVAVGSGHSLSKIQKWRENNKYFLQFVAGAGLIILSSFVYVNEILSTLADKI